MTPKSNVEGLGSVLKHKKVVMHLTEEIHVLHQLHSGVTHSDDGCLSLVLIHKQYCTSGIRKRKFADPYVIQKVLKSYLQCMMKVWKIWTSG